MASGRGLQALASEQRRQAGHGAWWPRGGQELSPVGTVAAIQRTKGLTDSAK